MSSKGFRTCVGEGANMGLRAKYSSALARSHDCKVTQHVTARNSTRHSKGYIVMMVCGLLCSFCFRL
jgi:hypothetical protein